MRYCKIIVLFFLFFLLISKTTYALSEKEKLYNNIENIIKKHNIVSLNISIVYNNNSIFKNSFSSKEINNNSNNTLFRIASISKLFTATLFMKTIKDKGLSIDNNIEINGTQIKNPFFLNKKITYRDLLSHCSGLKEENSLSYRYFLKKISSKNNLPPLTVLFDKSSLLYSKEIWLTDKRTFNYSNLGFIILANKIEELLKIPFDKAMKQFLHQTDIRASFTPYKNDNRNIGALYSWDKYHKKHIKTITEFNKIEIDNYIPATNAAIFSPQGGIRASINNLENFLKIMLKKGKGLISETIWNEMHKAQYISKETKAFYIKYGLGVHITDRVINDVTMYGHSGGSFGLTSNLYYNANKKIGIAIICNGANLKYSATSPFYKHEEDLFKAIEKYLKNKKLL